MYITKIDLDNNEYFILSGLLRKLDLYITDINEIRIEGGDNFCIYGNEFLPLFETIPDLTTLIFDTETVNAFPMFVDPINRKTIIMRGHGFEVRYQFKDIGDGKFKLDRNIIKENANIKGIEDFGVAKEFFDVIYPSNVREKYKSIYYNKAKRDVYKLFLECIKTDSLNIESIIESGFKSRFSDIKILLFIIRMCKRPDRYFGYLSKLDRDSVRMCSIPRSLLDIVTAMIDYGLFGPYTNLAAVTLIDMLKWYMKNIDKDYHKSFINQLCCITIYHISVGLLSKENFIYFLDIGIEFGMWKKEDREIILEEFDMIKK